MKILLDESVPRQVCDLLTNHDSATVQTRGWSGIANGELLRRATAEFDLFITSDQGIRYEQDLANFQIAILQLSTNDLRRIRAAGTSIVSAIDSINPGELRELTIP